MAVISSAFGSVTLTDEDAKKFKRQVTYGRAKAAAKVSVSNGVKLAEDFRSSNRELKITAPLKGVAAGGKVGNLKASVKSR